MRVEGYSSHFVCLSVCHFSILEKAPISGLKLTSVYIVGDDLSPLNVALFLKIEAIVGEKASKTSAVTAVIYSGTAQSLNGLARDLIAHGTLYQSCHSRCSCVGFFPSRSYGLAVTAFLW